MTFPQHRLHINLKDAIINKRYLWKVMKESICDLIWRSAPTFA